MHIYFGAFFALVAFLAIGALIWNGWKTRSIGNSPSATLTGDSNRPPADGAIDTAGDRPDEAPAVSRAQMLAGLAWLSIFVIALISPEPASAGYKGTILFCLLLAGLAVAFYRGIPAPVSVAGAFLLFELGVLFVAFVDFSQFRLPSPLVLLAPALGILAYVRLVRVYAATRPLPVFATSLPSTGIPSMDMASAGAASTGTPSTGTPSSVPGRQAPVSGLHETGSAFLVLLTITTWQAVELWSQRGTSWTLAALAAVLVYWLTILLHHKSEQQPAARQLPIYTVAGFLLAHLLLALSVWTG